MSDKLKPITILLPPETMKQIEQEAKTTGVPKGIALRIEIVKIYNEKKVHKNE